MTAPATSIAAQLIAQCRSEIGDSLRYACGFWWRFCIVPALIAGAALAVAQFIFLIWRSM